MLPVCYLNISFSACKTTKSKGFSQSRNMEPDAKKQQSTSGRKRCEHTRSFTPHSRSLHYFKPTKRTKAGD